VSIPAISDRITGLSFNPSGDHLAVCFWRGRLSVYRHEGTGIGERFDLTPFLMLPFMQN
jgi:hypothetical protein